MGGSRPNRFERFTASTALSGSTFCKPPALPEVADLENGIDMSLVRLGVAVVGYCRNAWLVKLL